MKIRGGLTNRFQKHPNQTYKRKGKRKDNQRLSNSYKRNKFDRKSGVKQPDFTEYNKAESWLEKAMEFIFGMSAELPPKGNRKEVNKLIGGGHVAGSFKDEIGAKLGHLLV